jgi:hypothetical protein
VRRSLLLQANHIGLSNAFRRANPQSLPCQTSFAEKAASLQDGDDRFLACGDRRELHRPALDVKDRICWISLRKDRLFVSVVPKSQPSAELFAENCVTHTETALTRHSALPL